MPTIPLATSAVPVNTGPRVDFVRQEVKDMAPRWDLIRDVLSGEKTIKDKGEEYLPVPNAEDTSADNKKRYDNYLLRAVFYGVTGRTLKGMTGQVFARDPITELPKEMEALRNDVDGAGVSLNQQARRATNYAIAFGRGGILTDFPKREAPATVAEMEAGNIRPTITLFAPENIINWRTITVGAKKKISLVVLKESDCIQDDGFELKTENYFRVLRLIDGVYHSQVWYYESGSNSFIMESDDIPKDAAGKPFDEITFQFIGAENNDPAPDQPPLYDMAILNVAHYRNSADYEEACFICGQPTPVFAGLTQQWVDANIGGKVYIGSRSAIPLPVGGSAELMQPEQNIMPREAMQDKERQMVALGAKLVEQKAVQRTAMEAGMEEASTTSLLAMCAKNVSAAYTAALVWAGRFLGVKQAEGQEDKGISFTLNSEFDFSKLTPQEVAQVIAAWQAGAISKEEMRDLLRRGGVAYQTDEDYQASIDSEGINLNVPVGSPASQAESERLASEKQAADKLRAGQTPSNK